MSFATQYVDANNAAFQQRVFMAMLLAAEQIASELTSTSNHANRVLLVKAVIGNPQYWGPTLAAAVIANLATSSITAATAQDSDISTSLASIWNGAAGAL